jgi:hypothetical protein
MEDIKFQEGGEHSTFHFMFEKVLKALIGSWILRRAM